MAKYASERPLGTRILGKSNSGMTVVNSYPVIGDATCARDSAVVAVDGFVTASISS